MKTELTPFLFPFLYRIRVYSCNSWLQLVSVVLIVVLFVTPTQIEAGVCSPVFWYYHGDHLGSTNIITDRAGSMVWHYENYAFGKERYNNAACTFSISNRYTGQVFDDDTGLYYYNARYYDTELGRFIQPDTIVPDPLNPQDLNRYSYVRNNPLNYIDPTGHEEGERPLLVDALSTWDRRRLESLAESLRGGWQIIYWNPFDRAQLMGITDQLRGALPATQSPSASPASNAALNIVNNPGIPNDIRAPFNFLTGILIGAWQLAHRILNTVTFGLFGVAYEAFQFGWQAINNVVAAVMRNAAGAVFRERRGGTNFYEGATPSQAEAITPSRGTVIVQPGVPSADVYAHEMGHVFQAELLGPAYYPVVGALYIPGAIIGLIPAALTTLFMGGSWGHFTERVGRWGYILNPLESLFVPVAPVPPRR